MQIHQLSPNLKRKKQKRVGRGGKRGKTSGRGEKGQKARAGHRIRPAERDLLQRLPKLRGIKHRRLSPPAVAVRIADLAKRFEGNEVTPTTLHLQGFLTYPGERVKIVGGGKLARAFTVKGVPVSANAKRAIEAAGGRVEE